MIIPNNIKSIDEILLYINGYMLAFFDVKCYTGHFHLRLSHLDNNVIIVEFGNVTFELEFDNDDKIHLSKQFEDSYEFDCDSLYELCEYLYENYPKFNLIKSVEEYVIKYNDCVDHQELLEEIGTVFKDKPVFSRYFSIGRYGVIFCSYKMGLLISKADNVWECYDLKKDERIFAERDVKDFVSELYQKIIHMDR